jgi:hypothetical protein
MIYSGCIFIDATEHDRLIVGRDGIEFPLGTQLVEWPAHGVATFKPFTSFEGLDKVRVQHIYFRFNVCIAYTGW